MHRRRLDLGLIGANSGFEGPDNCYNRAWTVVETFNRILFIGRQ